MRVDTFCFDDIGGYLSIGRFFEVTPAGEVVWEYVNPYFYEGEGPHGPTISNRVFRCYRYGLDEIPWLAYIMDTNPGYCNSASTC